ncbi:MAG: hypothetical protein IPM74_12670 [Crocinitomicaceae bacterium]|nr:hypothetical protein [Crocinitomicaceae bacterium]
MERSILHHIVLKKFDFPNGEIPFAVLTRITDQLRDLSEGALRLYLEGHSNNKRGRDPEWMRRSLDFSLAGIKKGSTILQIKAPVLSDALGNFQQPLFDELGVNDVREQSALSLACIAYEKATQTIEKNEILDKNLLQIMLRFNKLFSHNLKASIDILGDLNPKITIAQSTLQKIKILDEKTPADQKIKLTGKFEMMRHSNNLLELVNANGKSKAHLSPEFSFEKARSFLGNEITCIGLAHFNPKGKIVSIEIQFLEMADKSTPFFENSSYAIQEQIDLPGLVAEQSYKGTSSTKINQFAQDVSVNDNLDDLLDTINQ